MNRSLRAATRLIRGGLALVLAGAVTLLACNAPFIPVPPPDNVFVSQMLTDASGNPKTVWITQGKPEAHAALAKFFIFNDSIGAGVIVDAAADGSYVAPALDGTRGDRIFIYYTTPSGSDSESVCRQLVEGDPAPSCSQ
jgi:hypothetical protein